jgi:hypothetical protein
VAGIGKSNQVHCPKFGWTITVEVWPFRCECPKNVEQTLAQRAEREKRLATVGRVVRKGNVPDVCRSGTAGSSNTAV